MALRERGRAQGAARVASTGCSTTRAARRTAARPRRRSTSCSACRGSRRSCARTAASWSAAERRSRADHPGRPTRRPALPHHRLGRAQHDRGDGAGRARARLEYLAITDHSATHGFGNDVTPEQLRRQIERVRELDETLDGFELLVGTEIEHPARRLARLRRRPARRARLGRRLGPHVVRHVDGEMTDADRRRLRAPLDRRDRPPDGAQDRDAPALRVDTDAVFAAAARTGTMLEINSAPDRRDLNDVHARAARARRACGS